MIYLNHILSKNTPLYADSGTLEFKELSRIEQGDSNNNTELSLGLHTGTHIDAPYHFDNEGKKLEDYDPDFWFCNHPFLIRYAAGHGEILSLENMLSLLESIPYDCDLLLLQTGFEQYRTPDAVTQEKAYIFKGPGLAPELGLWLRTHRKLKMIGFDFISVTSYTQRPLGRVAHRAFLTKSPKGCEPPLLQEPILVIEDMKLSGLSTSPKKVIVAPLLYQNANGSPVTVIAKT
ncbi:cyclase family protein [Deltaproteobacteria bacterium TL4]